MNVKMKAFSTNSCRKDFTGKQSSQRKLISISQAFNGKIIHFHQGTTKTADIISLPLLLAQGIFFCTFMNFSFTTSIMNEQ